MFVPMLSMALSSLVYGDSAAKVEVGPGDGANGLVQCSATLFPNVSCAETAHNCVPRCSPYKNCSCGFTDLKKHPDGPCPPRNPDLRNGKCSSFVHCTARGSRLGFACADVRLLTDLHVRDNVKTGYPWACNVSSVVST